MLAGHLSRTDLLKGMCTGADLGFVMGGGVLPTCLHQGELGGSGGMLASTTGSFSYAEKRAWYTLSAHALKAPEILLVSMLP